MRNLTRRSFVARALGGDIAAPAIISTPRGNEPLPSFPSLYPSDALLLRPGDSHFVEYQTAFNHRTTSCAQSAKTTKAIGAMVDWPKSNGLSFALRCGYSYEGFSKVRASSSTSVDDRDPVNPKTSTAMVGRGTIDAKVADDVRFVGSAMR